MTKNEVQKKLDAISAKIEQLEEEKAVLENTLNEIVVEENTIECLNSIYRINSENTMTITLMNSSRTTPIMDRFASSDNQFLVFNHILSIYSENNGYQPVSLVITEPQKHILLEDSRLTMTDLKKASCLLYDENDLTFLSKSANRIYPLMQEIFCALSKNAAPDGIIPFEKPIRLGVDKHSKIRQDSDLNIMANIKLGKAPYMEKQRHFVSSGLFSAEEII